jgi:TolB-like protein/DNA-binding winged helix-turn-helix (wHTH) protein/Tfp pilus assembly protein PilF
MKSLTPDAHVFRFGGFELDTRLGELRRHGLKIRLPEQSFQVLQALLMRPGELVTRDELRQLLWTSDTFVDVEVGLNSAVRKLREALDDSADNPRFVETVPRRGYRFVGPVNEPTVDPAPAAVTASDTPVAQDSVRPSELAAVSLTEPLPASEPIRRLRPTRWRAAALLLVLVVGIGGVAYIRGLLSISRPPTSGEPIRSLVVLPFENLTGDPAQDYFADSVTDAVTAHLAQVDGVDVISRTSARQYKQTVKRLPQIRTELDNVEGVVEGAVQRSGDAVRITVKLIRAATDRNLWAHIYEDDMSRMFALQQQIASDVAVAAGRRRPTAPRAQTVNPKAYQAYLNGVSARGVQRHEGFRRAVGYLEEAVAIQPDFAAAYAELAMVQVQFLFGGPYSPHQIIPKAEAAARKALELDENLPKAHRALGQLLSLYYWRWEEGDKALERATILGGLDTPSAISNSLIRRGRFHEAIAAAERGRKLDPLSLNAQVTVGTACRAAGEYDRAIRELRRALEMMSPPTNWVQFEIGVTLVAMSRPAEAIRELEIAARQAPAQGHNSRFEAYLGYAYAAAGRAEDARKVLKELEAHRQDQYVSWYGIALIHDALREKAQALAALQRAFEDRAVEFGLHDQYAPFKTIASEPAFQAVVRKVGL